MCICDGPSDSAIIGRRAWLCHIRPRIPPAEWVLASCMGERGTIERPKPIAFI